MSLPKFNEFYLPILEFFKDEKIHSRDEVSNYLIDQFKLSEEEVNETSEKGKVPIFYSK